MTSPLAAVKAQGPHVPTLAYAAGIVLAVVVLYHLIHRHH